MRATPPMAPGCALGVSGQRLQLERCRQVGKGATLIERTPRCLTVELDSHTDKGIVEELLAAERECCPFFAISWDLDRRCLTFSVSRADHGLALDAIFFAVDVEGSARR